jgi:pullulanase
VTLIAQGGNMTMTVDDGAYRLDVDASDASHPKLTVSPLGPYGTAIFLRGSMNEWGADPASRFRYLGDGRYRVETALAAGDYEFKVADADWRSVNVGAATGDAGNLATGKAKILARGVNPDNLKFSVPADARYAFELEAANPDAPVLAVTELQ